MKLRFKQYRNKEGVLQLNSDGHPLLCPLDLDDDFFNILFVTSEIIVKDGVLYAAFIEEWPEEIEGYGYEESPFTLGASPIYSGFIPIYFHPITGEQIEAEITEEVEIC